jgi:hypothetical protein
LSKRELFKYNFTGNLLNAGGFLFLVTNYVAVANSRKVKLTDHIAYFASNKIEEGIE